ncbi:MAG: DegT/DnrJ/EryC1/StrS family aminotransferase [Candidatus Xenobium sp.]|jgi:dTDP-4-amino-4,6-dideoxygalactose transaminase|nr:aminotransferase class I/II-fold pyridoxal phosphate-dependent enzyme [Burkholderiales bacterium]
MSKELALFGAQPEFDSPLHVGQPNLGDRSRLQMRFDDILDRAWYSNNGIHLQRFEEAVADFCQVPYVLAVTNATLGLQIAVRALGLTGEVIVPSLTFVATAHCLEWEGVRPVFADIGPGTHNLDPQAVERAITPQTSGILPVHLWGRPCAVEAFEDLARRHGLHLLYDAAHALGSSHAGTPIGNFGEASILSFHATKMVNSFEGGAILLRDEALAEECRLLRNFGFAGKDRVISVGTNAKMHEFSAAMGLTSLEAFATFAEVNQNHYYQYCEEFAGLPGLKMVEMDPLEVPSMHYVVAIVDPAAGGLTRDDLLAVLEAENVLARRYFYPGCHRMAPYADRGPWDLPVTEDLLERVIQFPTGTALDSGHVHRIGQIVRKAFAQVDRVRAWRQRLEE